MTTRQLWLALALVLACESQSRPDSGPGEQGAQTLDNGAPGRAGPDKAAQDKAAQDKAAQDKAAQDKAAPEAATGHAASNAAPPGARPGQTSASQAGASSVAATPSQNKRACLDALVPNAAPRFVALLRALCSEWVERDIPGLALAVVESGRPILRVELGVRCRGDQRPVTAATVFRLGSVSKVLTAALAVELAADERAPLRLSTRADAVLPELRLPGALARGPAPTLEALLDHRSGLGSLSPAAVLAHPDDWPAALADSGELAVAAAPGRYHYSNIGYVIAGAMLERATGRSYAELLAEAQALRHASTVTSEAATAERRGLAACGHRGPAEARVAVPVSEDLAFMPGDSRWLAPAGGVLASASELAQLPETLPRRQLDHGEAPPLAPGDAGGDDARYHLGLRSWALDDGARAYGHRGDNGLFFARLAFVPGGLAIALLTNAGGELPATTRAIDGLVF